MILRVKNIAKIEIIGAKISKLRVKDQAITRKLYIIGPKSFKILFHEIIRDFISKNEKIQDDHSQNPSILMVFSETGS